MNLKRSLTQALKFIAFLIAGIALLWLAFRKVNFSELIIRLSEARYEWLILSIIFASLAYVSRARRWVLLVNPLGYKPGFRNTFYAIMIGYLANIALPRLGEVIRCIALGRKEKIPASQLFGTVVIERTVDVISCLLIMIVMLLVKGSMLGSFLMENVYNPLREKIILLFGSTLVFWIALLVLMFVSLYLIYRFRNNLKKIRFFDKLFNVLKGIFTGLKTIMTLERKKEFLFHTLFIWTNYAIMTWVVFFSLKSTSSLDFADGIFILILGSISTLVPVQGGIGAFHFIISRGLNVIYGISLEDGLAYAVLSHESQLIFSAILGFIAFYALVKKDKIKLTRYD
ncbi:MAG TPA: lysylphosphatidylglycerol synthase transmembrane domain-containing protein [Bacteroidales bacterium]|nr:flippase-like domain-containing protein [Bacteroidales bacterium]HQG35987.1 lysylphosphatidylglycerol synthase transmembrane domain-containing protein [Bacteroidales bacterium]HQG52949.1 lysylphosphatidylglycerol synthase transmembrane domain-containing protein [Bacteroidales bacterium]HQJ21551.1 lysylphosphatidylglycerol synthase transmembrane domain-containing protein [Bacteroidales bacterium]HRC88558.1 lysylphosphatidylglycerol synthase transmembrane domain-containing protein [Bacteroidal